MDRYAVVGNPIAHSKSPQIHEAFARSTSQRMTYERILAPIGGFAHIANEFAAAGGKGLNITVPFKLDALALAHTASERAQAAGACNTLKREADRWYADNTDGAGIVRDLASNLGVRLEGADVLVLGAGGAARGVLLPVLAQKPRALVLSNRTQAKADALVASFAGRGPVSAARSERASQRGAWCRCGCGCNACRSWRRRASSRNRLSRVLNCVTGGYMAAVLRCGVAGVSDATRALRRAKSAPGPDLGRRDLRGNRRIGWG